MNPGGYLPGEVITNEVGPEWRAGSFTNELDFYTGMAVSHWNETIQTTPNSLTKYIFHCCWTDDVPPAGASGTANVRVVGYPHDIFITHCIAAGALGCVDDLSPGDNTFDIRNRPLYIIIDTDNDSIGLMVHEFGHILYLADHYAGTSGCNSTYVSIMDRIGCDASVVQAHDEADFKSAYKPLDKPNFTSMTINSNSDVTYNWNSSASVRHNIKTFYVDRTTDTNTTVVQFNEVPPIYSGFAYAVADDDRFCATARGYSAAGFISGDQWTPYPYYGCWNRRTGPTAGGPFVATTHRTSTSQIRIRIKNFSGATRQIKVVGPNAENIGCDLSSVSNNGTRSCLVTLSQQQYPNLVWIACTTTACSAASYGNVDFD